MRAIRGDILFFLIAFWSFPICCSPTYMPVGDTSTCDKFDGSALNGQDGSKSIISAKRQMGTLDTRLPVGHQCISMRQCVSYSLLHDLPTCEDTTHNKRQSHLRDAPDRSRSKRLSSPSRDHRFPPSCNTHSTEPKSIHPARKSALVAPKRVFSTATFPDAYIDNDRSIYDPRIYTPGASYSAFRWTRVEYRQARLAPHCPADMGPAIRKWLVIVSSRKHVPIVYGGELEVNV